MLNLETCHWIDLKKLNLYSIISKYHLQSPGFTHFCASFEGWLKHEDLSWICLKWPGWSLYTPGWSLYTGAGPKVNAQILDKSDWELQFLVKGGSKNHVQMSHLNRSIEPKKNRGQFLWTTGLLGSNFTRNQTSPWIHEVLQQLRRVAKKMRLPEISFDHRWFKCCLNLQKSSKEHFCVLTGKPKSSRADHRGRPKPAGPHLDKTQLRTKAVSACALPGSETSHTGLHQQARGKINLWFWLKCLN